MTQALQVLQWAVGVGLVLLALVTVVDWVRHRGRSRRYLALTVTLLAGVAMLQQLAILTDIGGPIVIAILLALFEGSAYAVVLFRDSLVPMHRVSKVGLGVVALVVGGAAIVVDRDSGASTAVPTGFALAVNVALLLSWSLLVGVSILRLWRASSQLPAVQRTRLRALNSGFTALVVAIIASAASVAVTPNLAVQITIESVVIASLPFLAVAFAPPGWLRRSWREREEVRFRAAINDLLLYSPDVPTLARRGLEWPSRLLGGNGSMMALAGAIVAYDGIDETAAGRLHEELEPRRRSAGRSLVTSAGPTAVVPLDTRAGEGYLAVIAGTFTPLFGDEELARLQQYGVSITVAVDRVHLSEGIRRNAELLDLAYDAVFTWGFDGGGVEYWNRAAAEMYGFTAEEAVGREPWQLLHTELPAPIAEIREFLAEHDHWEGELVQKTRDGRTLQTSARWALQRDADGRPSSVLEINRDISGVKRASEDLRRARDAAENASTAKSEYLSRMSHELRTPLAAMLGFSDLLELREPRDDQKQAIDAIQRAGAHLLSLVNDVLDIARIESGRETLSLEPIEVRGVLEECQGLVSRAALERGTTLALELGTEEPLFVRADRQRLVQVMLNLLTNAIKYGGDRGTVRTRAHSVGGDRVEIDVIDSGPGVSEADRELLFQPFERLGAERSPVEGTGLGLALARQLTTAMGGEIGVRSDIGQGAAFWIRLERASSTESRELVRAAGPPVLRDTGRQSTVLYVEDNLATIGLVESIFALRPSLRLVTAMQGGMGIDLAREQQPELIILDLHLPDMNGDEVMRRLQADPRTASIPVVVYSADATERQVGRLLAAGARAYLTKPARVAEFLAMLDQIAVASPDAVSPR